MCTIIINPIVLNDLVYTLNLDRRTPRMYKMQQHPRTRARRGVWGEDEFDPISNRDQWRNRGPADPASQVGPKYIEGLV